MLEYPLITTIVISVVFAFLLGFLAHRLRLPTILGYLVAGVMLGPHTPGFVANIDIAKQLAEIGVILLMFGVGLHFSIHDLIAVRKIALFGALFQISITVAIGCVASLLLKHNFLESLIFGLVLSVASTIVLLRAFEQYRMLHTKTGRIAIGWLIAEDAIMILVVVLLPIIANMMSNSGSLDYRIIFEEVTLVIFKISAFIIVMMVAGKKLLPRLLIAIARTNSRELMSLGTLAISSGFAFIAYTLFGASFALGAFIVGMILNESAIGRKSAEKSLPLRDIFAVLFFISAGMLFDPKILIEEPLMVLVAFFIVVFVKPVCAFLIMRFFRHNVYDSMMMGVSLAQIGEFSFILTALALKLEIFSSMLYDMVIASALLSIMINPFLFKMVKKYKKEIS